MTLFILLLILLQGRALITINYDNITINIVASPSQLLHVNDSSQDRCNQLIIKSSAIYHLSSEGIFQDWLLTTMATNFLVIPPTANGHAIDMVVYPDESKIQIVNQGNGTVGYYLLNSSTKAPSFSYEFTYTSLLSAAVDIYQQHYDSAFSFYFFCHIVGGYDVIYKTIIMYTLPSVNANLFFSPDGKLFALCNPNSVVYLYRASTMSLLHTFTPLNPVNGSGITNKITFDSNSSLMIIETDGFNPIQVVNCTSYAIVYSISYSSTIKGVSFIANNLKYLVIIGTTNSHLYDTRTGLFYDITGQISSTSTFDVDFNSNVFMCASNTIYKYTFQYGVLNTSTITNVTANSTQNSTNNQTANLTTTNGTVNSTANSTANSITNETANATANFTANSTANGTANSTTNSTANGTANSTANGTANSTANGTANSTATNATNSTVIPSNSQQSKQNIDESSFYHSLNMSETQRSTTQSIGSGIQLVIQSTKEFAIILGSSPFIVYFLGFLNYLNLCSLYVLINFPIPEHVYSYLKIIFNNMNENIIVLLGIDMKIGPITEEKVDSNRALFFNVSSDMVASMSPQFALILLNWAVIFIFEMVFLMIKNKYVLKTMFNKSKWELIYGQIINSLIPFVLPWSFILIKTGFLQFSDKINLAIFSCCLFVAIVFPFFYFFNLVHIQNGRILNQIKRKQIVHQVSLSKAVKITLIHQDRKKKQFELSDIVSAHLIADSFSCLANTYFPLLVLIENPLFFLVGISFFTLCGSLAVLKDLKNNKNLFFLSLYPLLFHTCFLIFYFCSSHQILIYSEIACLLILLMGIAHFSLTVIVHILYFFFKLLKNICPHNSVRPLKALNYKLSSQLAKLTKPLKKTKGKTLKKNVKFRKNPLQQKILKATKNPSRFKTNSEASKVKKENRIKIKQEKTVNKKYMLVYQ